MKVPVGSHRAITEGDDMDSVALMKRVVAETEAIVDRIDPDQMGAATPCQQWTVRDVVNHITGGATMFAECVEHGSVGDDRLAALTSGDNLGADYKAAFHTAADRAVASFDQPGALDKMVKLPFGEMPGGIALNIAVFDVTTHACDLAQATGQRIEDEELLETALAVGRQMIGPELRQPGLFDAEQEPPEGASAAQRLLAFAGRPV
ncbi:MAG: hypothetical protein QOG64_1150 [Acidimicrobiaceae bacterium]|jgi:uncharacterized protein (TIGR03086 family)|nr:hypothetical protein [Acidimicrobiaceae bacterium]